MASEPKVINSPTSSTNIEKVETFQAPKRLTVKVADSPSQLSSYREIPIEAFCAKEGFQWTESVVTDFQQKMFFENNLNNTKTQETLTTAQLLSLVEAAILGGIPIANPKYPPNKSQLLFQLKPHFGNETQIVSRINELNEYYTSALEKLWQQQAHDLIVCQINERVGKGIFLSPRAKPIRKDEFVIMYTGEYKAFEISATMLYDNETLIHPIYSKDPSSTSVEKGKVDASHFGNESRFIQDLPTEAELTENYLLPPNIANRIATANLELSLFIYKGYPVLVLKALRDIQPGEQLGYSYGGAYWARARYLHGIKRCLFNKADASIVEDSQFISHLYLRIKKQMPHAYYPQTLKFLTKTVLANTLLNLKTRSDTFTSTLLNPHEFRQFCLESIADTNITMNYQFKLLIDAIELTEKLQQPNINYTDKFILGVKHKLLEHLAEYFFNPDGESPQKASYVQKLYTACNHATDAKSLYIAINSVLQDTNCAPFYKNQLALLRSELIQLVTQYNDEVKKSKAQPSEQLSSIAAKKK